MKIRATVEVETGNEYTKHSAAAALEDAVKVAAEALPEVEGEVTVAISFPVGPKGPRKPKVEE